MKNVSSDTTGAGGYPEGRLLMGPGPSMVHPRVTQALARPMVGHLDPQFLRLMDGLQRKLRRVFQTDNRLTIAVSGTGSAGMEACLVNLVERDDEVLVCVNGVFGERMADIVGRIGGKLRRIDRPWGEVFDPAEISAAVARYPRVRLVALVQAETSTGAHQPLEEIGAICRQADKLFMVDAVTSLGGTDLRVDDWRIDACYSGTQKCLSCPPGLAPLTFGERALQKLAGRKTEIMSWYLDLSMIERYWSEGVRTYHHTAPISMNYALDEALSLVLEEGLEQRFDRHRRHSRALMAGLAALGCQPFAQEDYRLPMLNAVLLPAEADDAEARRCLLSRYGIEIGGGLEQLAGKLWRIGLMGHSCRRSNVMSLLAALEELFTKGNMQALPGQALAAASEVYASAEESEKSAVL